MNKITPILKDLYPKSMKFNDKVQIQEFDNRFQYLYSLSTSGRYGNQVSTFLKQIKNGVEVNTDKVEEIRNTVRNNLIKRGIISGTVYEGFKYDVEGLIIDYAELASGNPECMLKPLKKYDKYFYELYINMSIPWDIDAEKINEGAIRLIETIKALEELNIEMKINIIMAATDMYKNGNSYLFILPICNHLEYKDYDLLYPYITGEFLRGPLFQTMRSGKSTRANLGYPIKLDNSVNLWEIDECTISERVLKDLDMKG